MNELTYLVWQLTAILFIALMAYSVARRALWFPGLVCAGSPAFAGIQLFGPIKVHHVIFLLGIILATSLFVSARTQKLLQSNLKSLETAPAFLFCALLLVLLRMIVEYIETGAVFFPYEIRDGIAETIIPALVLLTCRFHTDSFREFLRGTAVGSMLCVTPAFTDVQALTENLTDVLSGQTILFHQIHYKDRNTIAFWAFTGVISLVFLSQSARNRNRKYYYIVIGLLSALAIVCQSRRVFVALLVFTPLLVLRSMKKSGWLMRIAQVGLFAAFGYLSYNAITHFERFSSDEFLGELRASGTQKASISRADIWNAAMQEFIDNPVLGAGMAETGWLSDPSYSREGDLIIRRIGFHNTIFDILAVYGLVGATVALVFLLWVTIPLCTSVRRLGNVPLKSEIGSLALFWFVILLIGVLGGIQPEDLGFVAVVPCAIRVVIRGNANRRQRPAPTAGKADDITQWNAPRFAYSSPKG